MEGKYQAITGLLMQDSDLSLNLYYNSMNMGIRNERKVEIQESNPHKGEIVGDGDQQYCQGPRRARRGFTFSARDALEGLSLLERACKGEKGVNNTVFCYSQEETHGRVRPQPGIDAWLYEFCIFKVQKQGNLLVPRMSAYNFPDIYLPISIREVDSVDESVALFENNPVDVSIIRNIRRGSLIQDLNKRNNKWEPPTECMIDYGKEVLDKRFIENYWATVKQLAPFDIIKEVKDALFVSMLLENFYFQM